MKNEVVQVLNEKKVKYLVVLGVWGLLLLAGLDLLLLTGCEGAGGIGGSAGLSGRQPAFWVSKVHLQKSFTAVKGENASLELPNRVEAYVELKDQFGDPIKALGEFRFELFQYRPALADPRGKRFGQGGIQEVNLGAVEENQQHWDSISRSYRFDLRLPEEAANLKKVVLQVTFVGGPDYRVRDILVLER